MKILSKIQQILFIVISALSLSAFSQSVGISTVQFVPTATLEVRGIDGLPAHYALKVGDNVANYLMVIQNNGNVGIGWTTPTAKLSLGSGEIGYCRSDAADQTNYGRIGMDNGWTTFLTDNATWNTGTNQYNFVNGGGYGGWAAGLLMNSGQLYFNNDSGGTNPLSWSTRMFIAQNGNVGIGTTGTRTNLDVNG